MTPEVARFAVTSLKLESSTRKHPWPHGKANANASRSSFASTIEPCPCDPYLHICNLLYVCIPVYSHICMPLDSYIFLYVHRKTRGTDRNSHHTQVLALRLFAGLWQLWVGRTGLGLGFRVKGINLSPVHSPSASGS